MPETAEAANTNFGVANENAPLGPEAAAESFLTEPPLRPKELREAHAGADLKQMHETNVSAGLKEQNTVRGELGMEPVADERPPVPEQFAGVADTYRAYEASRGAFLDAKRAALEESYQKRGLSGLRERMRAMVSGEPSETETALQLAEAERSAQWNALAKGLLAERGGEVSAQEKVEMLNTLFNEAFLSEQEDIRAIEAEVRAEHPGMKEKLAEVMQPAREYWQSLPPERRKLIAKAGMTGVVAAGGAATGGALGAVAAAGIFQFKQVSGLSKKIGALSAGAGERVKGAVAGMYERADTAARHGFAERSAAELAVAEEGASVEVAESAEAQEHARKMDAFLSAFQEGNRARFSAEGRHELYAKIAGRSAQFGSSMSAHVALGGAIGEGAEQAFGTQEAAAAEVAEGDHSDEGEMEAEPLVGGAGAEQLEGNQGADTPEEGESAPQTLEGFQGTFEKAVAERWTDLRQELAGAERPDEVRGLISAAEDDIADLRKNTFDRAYEELGPEDRADPAYAEKNAQLLTLQNSLADVGSGWHIFLGDVEQNLETAIAEAQAGVGNAVGAAVEDLPPDPPFLSTEGIEPLGGGAEAYPHDTAEEAALTGGGGAEQLEGNQGADALAKEGIPTPETLDGYEALFTPELTSTWEEARKALATAQTPQEVHSIVERAKDAVAELQRDLTDDADEEFGPTGHDDPDYQAKRGAVHDLTNRLVDMRAEMETFLELDVKPAAEVALAQAHAGGGARMEDALSELSVPTVLQPETATEVETPTTEGAASVERPALTEEQITQLEEWADTAVTTLFTESAEDISAQIAAGELSVEEGEERLAELRDEAVEKARSAFGPGSNGVHGAHGFTRFRTDLAEAYGAALADLGVGPESTGEGDAGTPETTSEPVAEESMRGFEGGVALEEDETVNLLRRYFNVTETIPELLDDQNNIRALKLTRLQEAMGDELSERGVNVALEERQAQAAAEKLGLSEERFQEVMANVKESAREASAEGDTGRLEHALEELHALRQWLEVQHHGPASDRDLLGPIDQQIATLQEQLVGAQEKFVAKAQELAGEGVLRTYESPAENGWMSQIQLDEAQSVSFPADPDNTLFIPKGLAEEAGTFEELNEVLHQGLGPKPSEVVAQLLEQLKEAPYDPGVAYRVAPIDVEVAPGEVERRYTILTIPE
jgi:hypothetical protein